MLCCVACVACMSCCGASFARFPDSMLVRRATALPAASASKARKNGTNGFKCRDAFQAGLRGHAAGAAQVPGDHAQQPDCAAGAEGGAECSRGRAGRHPGKHGIPSVVLSCLSMRLHVIFEMSGCESHRQVLYRRSWAGMPRCCSTSQRRATRQVLLLHASMPLWPQPQHCIHCAWRYCPANGHLNSTECPLQGREAYLEKRPPDFSKFRRLP